MERNTYEKRERVDREGNVWRNVLGIHAELESSGAFARNCPLWMGGEFSVSELSHSSHFGAEEHTLFLSDFNQNLKDSNRF